MKKPILILLASVLCVLQVFPALGQAVSRFIIDWSLFEGPYQECLEDPANESQKCLQFQAMQVEKANRNWDLKPFDPNVDEDEFLVDEDEPVLLLNGFEDEVHITYENHPNIQSPSNQLDFLDIVREKVHENINGFQEQSSAAGRDEYVNMAKKIRNGLNDVGEKKNKDDEDVHIIQFHFGFNIDPISGEHQGLKPDFLKCQINQDRDFIAVVDFVNFKFSNTGKVKRMPVLRGIGVCQRVFDKYLVRNRDGQWRTMAAAKSLAAFLLSISGKSRLESRRIFGVPNE